MKEVFEVNYKGLVPGVILALRTAEEKPTIMVFRFEGGSFEKDITGEKRNYKTFSDDRLKGVTFLYEEKAIRAAKEDDVDKGLRFIFDILNKHKNGSNTIYPELPKNFIEAIARTVVGAASEEDAVDKFFNCFGSVTLDYPKLSNPH